MKSLSPSQLLVFYRTYSRWQDGLQRRETWEEAVERYFAFFKKKFESKVPKKVWQKTHEAVLSMDVMPSMRALERWASTGEKQYHRLQLRRPGFPGPREYIRTFLHPHVQ